MATYEVIREVREVRECPRTSVVVPTYPAYAVEDYLNRYRSLIEAERKHFITTEHQYNDFIHKMDAIHQDLEIKFGYTLQANSELKRDNEELARRLVDIEAEYARKCETLKKMYYVHMQQNRKLETLEFDNVDLRTTADTTTEKAFRIHSDFKNIAAERDFLDARVAEIEEHHRREISQLRSALNERDQLLMERDRQVDRLNHEIRRLMDEIHYLKNQPRPNIDGILHQKDDEIMHLRHLVEELRRAPQPKTHYEPRPVTIVDHHDDETARVLRANLEEAYRTIEELRSRKPKVEIIEKPQYIEKIVEKIVEKPVERIVERRVPVEREVYHRPEPVIHDHWSDDRLERLVILAKKNFERRLKPLYYTIWKLQAHIEYLEKLLNQYKNNPPKERIVERVVEAKPAPPVKVVQDDGIFNDGIISVYHDIRRGIVNYIFEIFVRSTNHACHKKVNSLIVFIINVKELKEHHLAVYLMIAQTFMRVRQIVKTHCRHHHKSLDVGYHESSAISSRIKSPVRSPDKRKTVDIEFRDQTNSWVLDTMQNTKKRRGFDKIDPVQKEYLYLFRLLAIKYRVIYPLKGKPFDIDADLAVKLETKICKAFLTVLEIEDDEDL